MPAMWRAADRNREIAIGDRVRFEEVGEPVGSVVAVHDDRLEIDLDDAGFAMIERVAIRAIRDGEVLLEDWAMPKALRDPSGVIERDLSRAIGLLEELVSCEAGCGCWSGQAWDAEGDLVAIATRGSIERRESTSTRELLESLDRIAALDDRAATLWSRWLADELDATRTLAPIDPRELFAKCRQVLRRELDALPVHPRER